MAFKVRPTEELIKIAASGGGFRVDASLKTTNELIRIAAAASGKRATIIFEGLSERTADELTKIGAAGSGCVIFE